MALWLSGQQRREPFLFWANIPGGVTEQWTIWAKHWAIFRKYWIRDRTEKIHTRWDNLLSQINSLVDQRITFYSTGKKKSLIFLSFSKFFFSYFHWFAKIVHSSVTPPGECANVSMSISLSILMEAPPWCQIYIIVSRLHWMVCGLEIFLWMCTCLQMFIC